MLPAREMVKVPVSTGLSDAFGSVAATVTIVFMTFFMLLEGRSWTERFYNLLPEKSQPRWRRIGHDIYRTVGGYVTGNLLISLIAGGSTTIVLIIMGVPFAVALGLVLDALHVEIIPERARVLVVVDMADEPHARLGNTKHELAS